MSNRRQPTSKKKKKKRTKVVKKKNNLLSSKKKKKKKSSSSSSINIITSKKKINNKKKKTFLSNKQEEINMMTIRLRGRDGQFNYNLSSKDKFRAVSLYLSGKLGISSSEFSFYLDAMNRVRLERRKDLYHGILLYYEYDKHKNESLIELEHKKKREERELVGDGDDVRNLGLKYIKKQWTMNEFNNLVSQKLEVLKAQKYPRVSSILVDRSSGQIFQQLLLSMAFQLQRCGYLYGSKKKGKWIDNKKKNKKQQQQQQEEEELEGENDSDDNDSDNDTTTTEQDFWASRINKAISSGNKMVKFINEDYKKKRGREESYCHYLNSAKPSEGFHEITVDSIYEPLQEGDGDGFIELNDPLLPQIDEMMSHLFLERVGYIFSYKPSKKKRGSFIFQNDEVLRMAEHQSLYGSHFVTIACGMNVKKQECQFDAYQVTPQCVELYKKGILKSDPKNPKMLICTKPISFNRKEVTSIECFLCIVKVPIADYTSKIFEFGFPVRNRETIHHGFKQDLNKVKGLLMKKKREGKRLFVQQINDFHLLVFLVLVKKVFILKNDFPIIARDLLQKKDKNINAYKDILNMYLK